VDRHLKERMIGAVVLVAAANILIPEMLSWPRTSPDRPQAEPTLPIAASDGGKLKTYTIDLAKSAPTQVEPAQQSPPSVTPVPEIRSSGNETKEAAASGAASRGAVDASVGTMMPPAPGPKAETKPEAITRDLPNRGDSIKAENKVVSAAQSGWAVQIGSFGAKPTADRVATDLKRAGFASFVAAFEARGQTLYRVRVGPVRDRAAAEALLQKLKSQHPSAAIVASP
jgi:DedD protein